MSSSSDLGLNETMRNSLKNFLSSLQGDNSAITSFLGTLSSFNDSIQFHRERLQEETLVAVQNFASLISTVSLDILELEKTSDRIRNELETDVSTILNAEMSGLSLTDEAGPTQNKHRTPYPAYIKLSYKWLLTNLHNPYPSKEVKKDIASQSRCSLRDIDAWFTDVRKRIGWNALRKSRFSNKQEKIVAAANHVFKRAPSSFSDDLNVSLISEIDPNDIYRPDFLAMEQRLKSLYSGRFPELNPLTSPNYFVKMTGLDTTKATDILHHRPIKFSADTFPFPYPTPEPSPACSDTYPVHTDSSPAQSEPSSRPITPSSPVISQTHSLKRRRSSSSDSERSINNMANRISKMPRYESTEASLATANLPSPAYTVDLSSDGFIEHSSPLEDTLSEMSPSGSTSQHQGVPESLKQYFPDSTTSPVTMEPHSHTSLNELLVKRKRRLSDAGSQGRPKRPHNALLQPRLQTVSDPFPLADTSLFEDRHSYEQCNTASEVSNLKRKSHSSDCELQQQSKCFHQAIGQPLFQTQHLSPIPTSLPLESFFDQYLQDDTVFEHDFSDDIPSLVNMENILLSTTPLESGYNQYDVSVGNPEIYFIPDISAEECSVSTTYPKSSKTGSNITDSPCRPEILQKAVSTAILPDLDNFISTTANKLSAPSPYIPFGEEPCQSLSTFEWSTGFQPFNSPSSLKTTINTVTADLNHPVICTQPIPNSSDAKRAKIQLLNEQIRQLEAEL